MYPDQPRQNSGSRTKIWMSRFLKLLAGAFMLFDGTMKIVKPPQVLEANARLAFPLSSLSGVGIVLIACTLLYLIPRTSIFGAILLTGYLGGAVSANVRASSGWFETIFPALFAVMVWIAIALRDRRLETLLIGKEPALATHN